MKFKKGQVLLFNWSNPYANLIRWRNKFKYGKEGWAHCGIITDKRVHEEEEQVLVHEAISRGFVSSWYPVFWLQERIKEGRVLIGETNLKLSTVKKHADNYLGRGYAWFDIFNIALYWILGKAATTISTGAKSLICSEAVCRILYDASSKRIDFEKEYGILYDFIEPQHIRESKQMKWFL